MYDIRQFKPTLYALVVLGLTGFAMAAESLPLWVFSVGAVALNAWLIKTKRFRPLPRLVANGATILAMLYVVQQILAMGGPPLMFIGQFLVLLQIIKLFEQRANRDYSQLIILSLLLMVAAAINTASLLFGLLFIVYLVLGLYCCLIFHLKVEADRAKAALSIPEDKLNPGTLRQDQRFLPRSMRRLTWLVAVCGGTFAVVVFLFFPRGPGQGVLGQLQFKPAQSLTGFSDRVQFDQINNIKQNDEVVAHVSVWRNDNRIQGTETLMLRGLTLDVYGAQADRAASKPQWTRAHGRQHSQEREVSDDSAWPIRDVSPTTPLWRQRIQLKGGGSRFFFALPGPISIRTGRTMTVKFTPGDESLATDRIILPVDYEVTSTNAPIQPDFLWKVQYQVRRPQPESDPHVLEQIREFMSQPKVLPDVVKLVLGERSTPPFNDAPIRPENEEAARKIEHFLQTNYLYTLDLTDSRKLFKDTDPVVAFLTKVKKGHCEYFASAMTLMCQSLNIPARMVVGFRCDEYNSYGEYYIVKQAHAHTWVEVLTPRGWVTFDPTSGREASASRSAGAWQSLKHFVDYLEYTWAVNVVAYDARDRQKLATRLDSAMMNAAYSSSGWMQRVRDLLQRMTGETGFWTTGSQIISGLVGLMALSIVGIVFGFIIQQRRLRRRAARIGLDTLPMDEQLRLARQLAFYDRLTRALDRHSIYRPRHLTPREFADSLVFLPAELYDSIRRLTQILYRVRYGQATLPADKQRRLERVVERIETHLDKGQAHAPG